MDYAPHFQFSHPASFELAQGDTGIVAPALIAEPGHVDEIADILRRVLKAL